MLGLGLGAVEIAIQIEIGIELVFPVRIDLFFNVIPSCAKTAQVFHVRVS